MYVVFQWLYRIDLVHLHRIDVLLFEAAADAAREHGGEEGGAQVTADQTREYEIVQLKQRRM